MLPTQQESGAASSNAQQMCKGLFQKNIFIIMIECGGIVVKLSKEPEVLEPQQDSCTIATLLPFIHHEAPKTEVGPLGLLVVEIEGNNCVSIHDESPSKGHKVSPQWGCLSAVKRLELSLAGSTSNVIATNSTHGRTVEYGI
jgi:hypothetical protein